ncbi:MAG TPA: LPS export ABC transporter permease LptG [Xanthobacteraceae bacterium]|nr:LPS export ABC transporter permease LptG [Xanthobacteraceae bacterium]
MITGTLARYFALHFLGSVLAVFLGIFALIVLFDYIELMRRHYHVANLSSLLALKTSLHRAPHAVERILPFCVLTGAMSCYLNLSRRHELIVARAAGISAWQFIMPALAASFVLGLIATMAYNPIAAIMFERSKDLEAELSGARQRDTATTGGRFWVRQQSGEGHSILNAASSREQGVALDTVTAFTFDAAGKFLERIEAKSARLEDGHWRLQDARVYSQNGPMRSYETYRLRTSLSPEQVRENFSTPETVPFWQLPLYIHLAEGVGLAAAGYRLQYQKLLAQPFMLAAMVLLAAAFSLRFFRFGGVPKMVLGGVAAGFLVYVMAKVTNDLGKAELLYPLIAAWIPVLFGGFIGLLALLYMEDG